MPVRTDSAGFENRHLFLSLIVAIVCPVILFGLSAGQFACESQGKPRMKRLLRAFSPQILWKQSRRVAPHVVRHLRKNPHGHNTLGSLVVTSVLAFLYFQAQPITAGTDPVSANPGELLADVEKSFSDSTTDQTAQAGKADAGAKAAVDETPLLTGREAILEFDRLLAEAQSQLEKVPQYSATFVKQERIGGTLTEMQVIQMRLNQHPLKVSMKWEGGKDAGQRVIYAEGENDGDMLVRKLTGFEARLGVISLNPCGTLALKHSRHPVTQVGLQSLTKALREQRASDLKIETGVTAKMLKQTIDGREAICLVTEYAKPEFAADANHEYRKSMNFLDSKSKLPICVRCYGWPENISGANPNKLDQTTLLELYAYKNIDFDVQMLAEDFKKTKLE